MAISEVGTDEHAGWSKHAVLSVAGREHQDEEPQQQHCLHAWPAPCADMADTI